MVCGSGAAVLRKSLSSAVVLLRSGGAPSGAASARAGRRSGRGFLLEPFDDAPEPVGGDVDAELRPVGADVGNTLGLDIDDAPVAVALDHHEIDVDLGPVIQRNDRMHARRGMRRVAVERNVAVVKRAAYETTVISDGDEIEIVNFVGGG